jgi:AraC family carnitine catabolism transcriptional activator
MERNLEEPLAIADIAARVGASQRQLERLFHEHTGAAPLRYYIDVRLDRARGLITQTDLSIRNVAAACGFNSPVHFSRTYKARFGVTPSHDRTAGRVPFQFRSFPNHASI